MSGLVLKLIVTPIGILVSSWIFPNVYFSRWYQPILLGIVAAIIGYMLEIVMLRKDTNILSTLLDFLVTAAIVYFGAIIFLGTSVTFWGAVLTGIVIAIAEYFQHAWLLRSGRVRNDSFANR